MVYLLHYCRTSNFFFSFNLPLSISGSKLRILAVDLGELAGFILLVQNSRRDEQSGVGRVGNKCGWCHNATRSFLR